jgi:hypothetical protein
MWLKRLLTEHRDLLLHFEECEIELIRYERLHNEYLEGGREYLLQKYRHANLTYVYRYLNSDIYKECLEDYHFIRQKLLHKQRMLTLIATFSQDIEIEDLMIREDEMIL